MSGFFVEEHGEETILVDRPGFKTGGWRHALLGGFDSHSSPPNALARLLRGPIERIRPRAAVRRRIMRG